MGVANPDRGQLSMDVGGASYIMQLSPNALSIVKKETGLGLKGVIDAFQKANDDPDFELVMTLIWASMLDHHPDLTKEQAMSFYPDGGLEEIIEKVQELFRSAFPKQSAIAEANPPKAATKKK